MSAPNKPRFTVNLEEIDRQLRRSATRPAPHGEAPVYVQNETVPAPVHPQAAQQPASRVAPTGGGQGGDPLHELARIVGQEDPFQSILGAGGTAAQQHPVATPSMSAPSQGNVSYTSVPLASEPLGRSPEVGSLSEQLRSGSGGAQSSYPSYSRQTTPSVADFDALASMAHQGGIQDSISTAGHPSQPAASQAQQDEPYGSAASYDDYTPSYADPKLGYQPGYEAVDEDQYVPARPSRRKWKLLGSVAVVGLVLAGIVYAARHTGVIGGGEPPVVAASTEPTKVAPEAPGGKEFPDQNKQIYQGNAKEGSTQVVNREEQPVDIHEATGARDMRDTGNSFGEPRKVRTVVIRPDGTPMTSSDPGPGAPAAPPAPAGGAVAVPQVTMPPPPQVTAPPPPPAPPPPVQAAQPARPPQAQPAATPPQRPPQTAARTQEATANQVPTARPSQQPATETSAPSPGGGYVVQFGIGASEAEGRTRYNRLKAQYPNLLGNVSPAIRPAEINGRMVYRIRTGGMSKEAGDTLCGNIKAAGGDCFVVRNN